MKNKLSILPAVAGGSLVAFGPMAAREQEKPEDNPGDKPAARRDQPPPRRGGMRDPMAMMKEQLSLTDDQIEKIKPILKDRQEKMTALRGDTSLSQEDRRAKMKEIIDASNAKIKPILTADQKEKFDKKQAHKC